MILWLLLSLQDPKAYVDAVGTHVEFDVDIDRAHIVDWDLWDIEITVFSNGSDLGTRKAGESSADSASYLASIANEKRVELVAKKQAKSDVTVEGFFQIWWSEKLVEKKIDRFKLEKEQLLPLGEYEATITEVVRKDGVVYLTAEFSTLTLINLKFVRELKFFAGDAPIKSREGSTQTTTYKLGKKDRYAHILRWELTTDESEVAVHTRVWQTPERKKFPFKVTAPLSGK